VRGWAGPNAACCGWSRSSSCDLLYIQGNSDDEEAAYRAVLAAARSGALSRARLLASVERVLALKARSGVL
jgi:beta-glucosidase-like glycosyl hydrolase